MKWKLRICVSSYSARGVQEIYDGESLDQYIFMKKKNIISG